MFIETSKDLLFVALAFCAIWITIFLSWLLYYVIAMMRDAEALLRSARRATEKIDALAHMVREKMERSSANIALVAQAAKEIAVWAIRERAKAMGKKKKGE
jgi:hypothetical protein